MVRWLVAILAFAVVYNLMSLAKNLVQEGMVGRVPGLWWPLALLLVAAGLMLRRVGALAGGAGPLASR